MRPKHRLAKRRLKIPFDFFQRTFFQSADLCLADADFPGYLHLRFPGKKTEGKNFFLSGRQIGNSLPNLSLIHI